MAKALMLILALVISESAGAQSSGISKLLQKLNAARRDTIKVNLFYSISRQYWGKNNDSVLLMAGHGIELADSLGFKKGKALNCLSMGAGMSGKGNYPEAIKYYLESLRISEELNLEGLSGNIYTNIAIVYTDHGDVNKGIEYFTKALHIAEKYGEAASCVPLLNLSDLYTKTGEYKLANKYALRALAISRNLADSSNLAIALFNISEIYQKTNRIDSAQWYLRESSLISTRIHDYHGISYCLSSLAEIKISQGKYREGIVLANQSLANLDGISNQELQMKSYNLLYKGYFGLRDFNRSIHFRNLEVALRDNIFNIEKEREANNLVNQYNLEHKELRIQLLEKDNKLQEKEISRESLIITIYSAGAVVLGLLTAYLIFVNIRWRNYNRIIKERNTLILHQKRTIIQQKINLERLNSVKDKIISIISHDFRSPLATLHGFLQVLKIDALTEEEKVRTTARIESSLTVTLSMVENLLAWGSSQRDGLTLNPVTFNLGELADGNIQLVHHRAESKVITLTSSIPTPTFILGDRDTINIVLRNLLSNAIKFSKQNDSISIALLEEVHRVVISVKDTGVGMSQEQQEKLFGTSLNISTTGTENEKGTGLGLALCQELIQQHGGEIWVESTLGIGSVFSFSIPRSSNFS